ncbi:peptidoglycan-binding protein [Leptolyngbya sp. FACHB-36]|uniref:peptidoglycan-binding protein n=1 Tax=Leptolyngbya sp. FACHB-36 TaxID=2692808 RepID=UPI001681A0A1|nr:peptidoglycan-binding protein [Leptolyngbya sp. FACHB-36]
MSSSGEPDVTALQTCLENAGYSVGGVDGIFGEQTRRAVEAFQRSRGLTVDGIAGPETLAALGCDGQLAQVDFEQEPDRTQQPPYYYDRPISGTNTASVSDRKRFVVIVPTTRVAKTSVLADVRRRLPGAGARAIDSPLGSYIEVNAFTNRSFAESQSRYLRGFGIDAQVRYF